MIQENNIKDLNSYLRAQIVNKVCDKHHLNMSQLNNMPLGRNYKRKYHDDITVIVVNLKK